MINKTVAMTITEIEKASQQFKNTHKVKVSGPYDDEQMPKWFKSYKEETDARFEKIETKLNNIDSQMPKWFKKWVEDVYEKVPPNWFTNYMDEFTKINNLKKIK